ncbi:hypothetical protein BSIN_2036 [Burkholderia singularis]|uniref:Uncharacterized protein n=1 Tax=Burkholderia singularis TaxID=1503053 RepID=A0A238H0K4_9BURK|nr:hypothetical protein BSIN_2036 [Burkholderia singularis]
MFISSACAPLRIEPRMNRSAGRTPTVAPLTDADAGLSIGQATIRAPAAA